MRSVFEYAFDNRMRSWLYCLHFAQFERFSALAVLERFSRGSLHRFGLRSAGLLGADLGRYPVVALSPRVR